MPLVLTTWVGSGSDGLDGQPKERRRPAGADDLENWSALDLHDGHCLIWHDTDTPKGALTTLGDAPADKLSVVRRNLIANRVGRNLASDDVSSLMADLWLDRAKAPDRGGRIEIWCGKLWYAQARIGGGSALATDSFTRADSADLGTNWDTQTSEGALSLASNHAAEDDGADRTENYNAVVWPNDQYSQAKIIAVAGYSTGDGPGVALRCSTSARTFYRIVINQNATNTVEVGKKVAGTYTTLANRNATYVSGQVLYAEVQGTTLIVKYNGSQLGASISDASIATGRAGISYSSEGAGLNGSQWDDWEGGDFSGGGAQDTPELRMGRFGMRQLLAQ